MTDRDAGNAHGIVARREIRRIRPGAKYFYLPVAGCLAAAVFLLIWSWLIEPGRLIVNRYEVSPDNWPAALDGTRAVILADLHIRPGDLGRLREIVEKSNALNPDMVFLLGDYVRGRDLQSTAAPELIAAELGRLKAVCGIFAVLGNHDWWVDGPGIRRALEDNRITVLENEQCTVRLPAGEVRLIGLPDWETRPFDPAELPPEFLAETPGIVLSHNPDVFPVLPPGLNFVVAGHTHGGQVNLPWLGRLVVPSDFGRRYAAGLVIEGDRTLLVSSGLGQSIADLRFCCPPEIVELTIRAVAEPPRGR